MSTADTTDSPPLCVPFPGLAHPRRWSDRVVARIVWAALAGLALWALLSQLSQPGWDEVLLVAAGTIGSGALARLFQTPTPLQQLAERLPESRAAVVFAVAHGDAPLLRAMLRSIDLPCVELDGRRIRSLADLARELDAALGPFVHPDEPAAKAAAHVAHESRGSGERAVLWRHAEHLWHADRAAFVRFVADWEHSVARRGAARPLFVELSATLAA